MNTLLRRRSLLAAAAVALLQATAGARADAKADALTLARARAVFGALETSDEGSTMREPRRLRMPGTSRERAVLPAGTKLRLHATHRVREAGRVRELLMWQGQRPQAGLPGGFDVDVTVLALFRAGEPLPIDVAEVQTDRQTFFADPAVLTLSPEDDAFELVNHHANAGQPYALHALYHLRDGRLRRIAEIDLLGSFAGCAKAFEQTVRWRSVPDADRALPRLIAEVQLVHAPLVHTEACRPRPAVRRELYQAAWRWDAAGDRYRAESGGTLEKLARWNERRR
jgi:hypothetical protein